MRKQSSGWRKANGEDSLFVRVDGDTNVDFKWNYYSY